MIGQLLTLSRWESDGERRTTLRRFDLAALVREVSSDADFEAQARGCSVVVEECEECEMPGTQALLRSAVENVVRNAVRYTPEGTAVRISLRCGERRSGARPWSRCATKERACPSRRSQTSSAPSTASTTRARARRAATGLGLAITERAVRLHGGTVTAANAPGGGLLVELRLPLNVQSNVKN